MYALIIVVSHSPLSVKLIFCHQSRLGSLGEFFRPSYYGSLHTEHGDENTPTTITIITLNDGKIVHYQQHQLN